MLTDPGAVIADLLTELARMQGERDDMQKQRDAALLACAVLGAALVWALVAGR